MRDQLIGIVLLWFFVLMAAFYFRIGWELGGWMFQ